MLEIALPSTVTPRRPFTGLLRRPLGFVLFIAIGASAAIGASLFHRAASKGDVIKFDLAVPALFPTPIELDLAARAWPRRLLAGDVAAFTARLKAEKPVALRIGLEGAVREARLAIDGEDRAEDRVIRLVPKRRTTLAVSFVLPPDRIGAAIPAEVFLLLEEEGTGRPLGRVPLRVIDTANGGIAAARGGDDAGHGAHSH